ncbi:hypothetical protein BgiMline_027418 [Biomphalaria glabrata]|nr:dual specificity protein kinase shkC isoform X1 [Biomphalaria glabrata]
MAATKDLFSGLIILGIVFHYKILLEGLFVASENKEVYIIPPRPKDDPYPVMLHERDVIHYVDLNKEFQEIGSGSFANVTLGELQNLGISVAIKRFRKSSFHDILHEVRVHRYVESLGFTPQLIGLLPTGPFNKNVSLVFQYVPNVKNLQDFILEGDILGVLQWIQICHEIAVNLHRLHQNDLLFNDLHSKNILVQKVGERVKTYIIDFGYATYRTSKLYSLDEKALKGYDHLAPELFNDTYTSVATDVYALGNVFNKIARVFPEPNVQTLAHWCMSEDPRDRPELSEVIARIERIYIEITRYVGCDKDGGNTCRDLISFQFVQREGNKTRDVESFKKSTRSANENIVFRKRVAPQLKQTGGDLGCITAFPVLNANDFVPGAARWINKYRKGKDNAIRSAVLVDRNQTVIVKEFYKVDFELIRQETCITMYLAGKGVTPKVIGFTIEYKRLSEIAFVQEFFGSGVTLKSFVTNTLRSEWNLSGLQKATESGKECAGSKPFRLHVCRVNLKNIFMSIHSDYKWPSCKAKSYRQKILEKISIQFVLHLQIAHDSGILINNFKLDNIIVQLNETKRENTDVTRGPDIEVRLIDLSATTSLTKGKKYKPMPLIENKHAYVAPEVVLGRATSKESDVYSACVALRSTLSDYFSSYDVADAFQPFRAKRRQSYFCDVSFCSRNESTISGTTHSRPNWIPVQKHTNIVHDSPYSKLQRLLLKCLHTSHALRPTTRELLQMLQEVSSSNYEDLWL